MPQTRVIKAGPGDATYNRGADEPPPYRFVVDKGGIDALEFRLIGPDLPHQEETNHRWGGKTRKSVTRYPGGETSVQVHGTEYDPVELQGIFDDGKWGEPGHALRMRNHITELLAAGQLVRLEYGEDTRWGLLDASFDEERRDRIHYTITFHPYWVQEPPELEALHELELPPGDLGTVTKEEAEKLETAVEDPPDAVDEELGDRLYLKAAEATNAISGGLQQIEDVKAYADLASDTAELALQNIRAAATRVDAITDTVKDLPAAAAAGGAEGVAELVAANWSADVERQARLTSGSLAELVRQFARGRQPGSRRFHIVARGETLQSIAEEELGDWSLWTDIADRNDLPTADIDVGDRLELPPS